MFMKFFTEKRKCATCLKKKRSWWRFKDCADCARQWRAFNRGDTRISPLQRAITAEQIKKAKKARKKAAKAAA